MEVLDGGKEQAEREVEAKAREIQKLLSQAGIDSVVNPIVYDDSMAPTGWTDKVTVYRDKGREWRWRRTSQNGEIVGASHEGFKNFADCQANLQRSCCAVTNLDVVVED